jgi:predicted O-methyltransferase YrrM
MTFPDTKPWDKQKNKVPKGIYDVKGMLGEEERRLLYWLARYNFTGDGSIIDAGAFIGASAFCLAAGAAGNPNISAKPVIHSYDLFVALDQYVADSISRDIRPLALGQPYIDIFNAQNAEHLDSIKTYSGDFLNHLWDKTPIEILFIDIAKTQELNSHILREFFPYLIPGKSIVVQQDFYHVWHPYIHVTMEYLSDYFEVIDQHVLHQSRVYRLTRKIPQEEIDRLARYDFSLEERNTLLKRSAESSNSPTREMLETIVIYDALISGDKALYESALAEFRLRHPKFESETPLWAIQATEVISYASKLMSADKMKFSLPNMKTILKKLNNKKTSVLQKQDVDLDRIIANYPSFHLQSDGTPWFLGISGDNLKYMHSLLSPGMRTIETGAGFSSLAFIAAGCHHTAICPSEKSENEGLEQRIRSYCLKIGLDDRSFSFVNACSQDVVANIEEDFDFVFVDGFHGFPIPIVDFYFLSRRLRVGGIIAIDDTNIWTGEIISKILMTDSDWEFLSEQDGKTAYFKRLVPHRDKEFSQQSFVLANSKLVGQQFIASLKM